MNSEQDAIQAAGRVHRSDSPEAIRESTAKLRNMLFAVIYVIALSACGVTGTHSIPDWGVNVPTATFIGMLFTWSYAVKLIAPPLFARSATSGAGFQNAVRALIIGCLILPLVTGDLVYALAAFVIAMLTIVVPSAVHFVRRISRR